LAIDRRDRPAPSQSHRQVEVGHEVAQDLAHARLPGDGEPVHVGPAEQDRVRSERQRLEDVGAAPDAAVEENGDPAVDRLRHAGQRVERADRSVDLAPAVVRDDDPVHARVDRSPRVVGMHDALEHDRQLRPLAQERQVVPREGWARVHLDEALDRLAGAGGREPLRVVADQLEERSESGRSGSWGGARQPSARILVEQSLEDGVARVLGDPLAAQEGEVCELEVARAPAEGRGVERDDDRLAPAGLGAADEALDEVVRHAPVELEPAGAVAQQLRDVLHRRRGLIGEDHRDTGRRRSRGDGPLRVAVSQLEHADRREQERVGDPAAEELDARVALGDVAQHARDDLPAAEGLAVRTHRLLEAGPGGDVCECLLAHRRLGAAFELGELHRDARSAAADAADVDLGLALDASHVPVFNR